MTDRVFDAWWARRGLDDSHKPAALEAWEAAASRERMSLATNLEVMAEVLRKPPSDMDMPRLPKKL